MVQLQMLAEEYADMKGWKRPTEMMGGSPTGDVMRCLFM
jgi:hypothetical protein